MLLRVHGHVGAVPQRRPAPVEDRSEGRGSRTYRASRYDACTKTGRAILGGRTLKCTTCRHHALEAELKGVNHCPLCHTPYPAQYRLDHRDLVGS